MARGVYHEGCARFNFAWWWNEGGLYGFYLCLYGHRARFLFKALS